MDDSTRAPDDESILRQTGYATQSVVAGLIGLVLSPLVIGFFPAAIGLHAGITHLRFRVGSRFRSGLGLALSGLAAIVSAGAMIAWGGALLSVLLQKSAIDQARQWAGLTPMAWTVTDLDGVVRASEALKGRLVYIDVCSLNSPYSPTATRVLDAFAAKHPEIEAFSWCPECSASDGAAYRNGLGVRIPIAVGPQSMTEPLTLIPATPTLVVIDELGAIRLVNPGTYSETELEAMIAAPTPTPRGLLGNRTNRTDDRPAAD